MELTGSRAARFIVRAVSHQSFRIQNTSLCTINIFIPDYGALSRGVLVEPSEEEKEQKQKLCCRQAALRLNRSGSRRSEPAELLRVICRQQKEDEQQPSDGGFAGLFTMLLEVDFLPFTAVTTLCFRKYGYSTTNTED